MWQARESREIYTVLVEKLDRQRIEGRPRQRRKDNIKTDFIKK